jgi:hypothetical protein
MKTKSILKLCGGLLLLFNVTQAFAGNVPEYFSDRSKTVIETCGLSEYQKQMALAAGRIQAGYSVMMIKNGMNTGKEAYDLAVDTFKVQASTFGVNDTANMCAFIIISLESWKHQLDVLKELPE